MNLLITGAWQDAEAYIPKLKNMGHEIAFLQFEKEALPCVPQWVEGIIGNGIFLFHPIEQFSRLRYIQLTSAGVDRVPLAYIQKHKLRLENARGVYSIPMAEFAVGGVLQLYKKSRFFMDNQKKHIWAKNRELQELHGKTVAIIGCGSVGTECAKRFRVFCGKTVGVDMYPQKNPHFDVVKGLDALNDVLTIADVVVLTVPLTDMTKGLINAKRIQMMKKGAVLVNISRGGIIDAAALSKALVHDLGGAVLDVFDAEPLEDNSPFWNMENVILSPHNSFVGEGNGERMSDLILQNLKTLC